MVLTHCTELGTTGSNESSHMLVGEIKLVKAYGKLVVSAKAEYMPIQ